MVACYSVMFNQVTIDKAGCERKYIPGRHTNNVLCTISDVKSATIFIINTNRRQATVRAQSLVDFPEISCLNAIIEPLSSDSDPFFCDH